LDAVCNTKKLLALSRADDILARRQILHADINDAIQIERILCPHALGQAVQERTNEQEFSHSQNLTVLTYQITQKTRGILS
jgi:hypothetical protein